VNLELGFFGMVKRFRSTKLVMKTTTPIMIGVAISLLTYQPAYADSLRGAVLNESGMGIPGLTVSLASPDFRGSPSITDSSGYYFIPNVPPRTDYYLEVYWGRELLYRKSIVIRGDSTGPPIKLNR
jgi:Carboxypeptidase regulatory-like domain